MTRLKEIMKTALNLEQLLRTCLMIGYALNAVLRKNTLTKQIKTTQKFVLISTQKQG
jgi:hypothetical protein